MKRILHFVLIVLVALSTIGTAAAKTRKKPRKEQPQEQEFTAATPLSPAPHVTRERKSSGITSNDEVVANPGPGPIRFGPPIELRMTRGDSSRADLRSLPQTPPQKFERPEFEEPSINRTELQGLTVTPPVVSSPVPPTPSAPAPPTIMNFDGLDFATWGAGHPPDTNGDVGPTYYIQTINTSIGIFRKSDGVRVAAFTFNTFMSQGHFGNLCDTNNFGDPVVLYDSFEDRWIITDFAFTLSGSNVINPPGNFQCVAASMTGDPVSGGWNFYSINTAGGLGDYPKFGIWPDGLYMSANMFQYVGGAFINPRVYAFNKAQMYAGAPSVQVVTFDVPSADFAVMPSNARLQAGTPPPGSPNYFISTWEFLNALTVYKFHVDWTHPGASTFTGPDTPLASTSWPAASVPNAPSSGGNALDVLQMRAMVQNQYTNLSGAESLWIAHTVRRQNTSGFAAPRWYQVDVTGGTVNPNIPQATTWDPDGANVIYRFMPSVAVDRAGDMAMGYSTSSSTTFPAIKYAGRLAADPINTFSQTEQLLVQGTGTQTGNCGSSACIRWGDYSAMTLDPDGCTFWATNLYYAVNGLAFLTRIGSFSYPSCTPVGAGGTVSGTVTATAGGAPISGATVQLGARTTTTDGSGFYSFTSVPAGTYPLITATDPGYNPASATAIVVTDGNTTTQNLSLSLAAASGCPTDTTQFDFQAGDPLTNVDITTSPGDVLLFKGLSLDQQNTTLGTSGVGITTTTWGGQTFTPASTGPLNSASINLFCSGCTGTTPNLTLSVRSTSGGLPTGADLASATITGFGNGGVASDFVVTFASPITVTAGTMYALVIRPTVNPSPGTYALTRSGTSTAGADVYAGGTRVSGATSGTVWSIPLTGGVSTDAGFKTFLDLGYSPSGTYVSGQKDSNPASGLTTIWSTLSFTDSLPANTSIQFQAAGSNSNGGPFNFVGPDGTPATFFTTSGASLAQFYGFRYLKYKAFLATTDTNVTPALNDVTLCYSVVDCSVPPTITPTPAQVCANTTGNTASGPAGETSYSWGITNGTITGGATSQTVTYTSGATGSVGLTLNIVEPGGCRKSASTSVTIDQPPTPTITPGGPTTVTYPNTVTLNSSSATGNQWYLDTGSGPNPIGGATSQAYIASASGNYTVIVTDANGCVSASSAPTAVVVNPATPVVTATGGTFVYNGTPRPGSGTATGGAGESLTVTLSYVGTGGTTYGPSATAPTLVGTYTVTAHTPGDANNLPGDSSPVALTITMATPVVVATGGTFTYNGNPQAGSGSATGGGGEVLTFTLSYSGTGATTYGPSATAPSLAGTYTVTAHTPGDANNSAGDSSATALTINKFNTLMAAFGGTVTYTGTPHAGSGQALGGAGELLPVTLSYQGISGTVYGPSATAPTNVGVYLVTAHTVGDANNNAEDSLPNALRINKATATIGVTAYCVSFDGSAHTAAGTATGVLSEALTGLVLTGTTHTAAGTYLGDAWSFTNANYSDASGTVDDSIVNAVITAPAAALTGSTGNTASVANAGAGATYVWGITGGTITAGAGTPSITFTAGAVGTLTLNVTVTTSTGCGVAKSANVTVANVAVTSVAPAGGRVAGGSPVTINGTGFESGATVMFGGSAATNVVFVSSIKLTATTPAHAAGQVNVTVTNPDTTTGTLTNGFTYLTMQFDANGDNTVDPSDIFFLVDYLFDHGPAPLGAAGMLSGDANGDGLVDPADIFYVINYLFMGGPVPDATPFPPRVTTSVDQPFRGALSLGEPATRNGRTYIPIILTMAPGSSTPQGIALKLLFGSAANARLQRAGAAANATTSFEVNRPSAKELSYLVAFDQKNGGLSLGSGGARSAVIAEVEVANAESLNIEFDPTVTILSDATGTRTANVASGTLQVTGIESAQRPGTKRPEIN